jgi:NTE family protein
MVKEELTLVLSGGAARCIAHLGVLQALEEVNIKPGMISGVSGGAIVGAFYCQGYTPKEILEIIKETSILKTLRPTWSAGLLKLNKTESIFQKYLKIQVFEKLKIPLFVSACDVENAQNLYFSNGELIPPLLGSCSFPPLFRPVDFEGKKLADGGLLNNLPVEPVKDQQRILGVNVNIIATNTSPDSTAQYTEWVIDVIVNNNIKESIQQCQVFFEPPEMKAYHLTDIGKADELFITGYNYAKAKMDLVIDLMEE